MDLASLWTGLGLPLLRLIFFISLGLFAGNLIESMNWTFAVSRAAAPITRMARLKDVSGASFSMAFFSGAAANTMLSEAYDKGEITDRELMLSNLFNSLPTYFLHLPTIFFITIPFIGAAAFIYVGLTLASAFLRTAFIVLMGRLFLPLPPKGCLSRRLDKAKSGNWRQALAQTWSRFTERIRKILVITVPVYVLIFFLNRFGAFSALEKFMAEHLDVFSWLPPQALSIVVFHVAAEFTAGLATAGALLSSGGLAVRDLVLALLLGNVLSTPMRAFRHQFPYYAGIFKPRMALKLVFCNQVLRAGSIVLVGVGYYIVG